MADSRGGRPVKKKAKSPWTELPTTRECTPKELAAVRNLVHRRLRDPNDRTTILTALGLGKQPV
ncbi:MULTISPECIES: hypothetical protein [unclassified Streptomyces]|uniref:hypothetical protein n=1 Tax=unclassified Streptomyces TaxID=2593676 RepID=UPI00131A2118|nr:MULTISPECIES: hypothetical protein [unclassified Streptomyces]MYT34388.1 hypothetical protein [Streptomyces sp. SID8354]